MAEANQNSALNLLVNIHFKRKYKEFFHMLFVFLYVNEKCDTSNMI